MSRQIIKGDELQLFLNDSAPFYATSHTLTLTGNQIDRNTKDDGKWGSSSVGKMTWELTAECLYSDNQYDMMFDMMVRKTRVPLKFCKVKNYSPNGLVRVGGDVDAWSPSVTGKSGYAYVTSLTANANTGENATYSITFTGAGSLKDYDNTKTEYKVYVVYDSEDLEEGMQLFNMSAYNSINSGWVFSENDEAHAVQLDISNGTLTGTIPENPIFVYYIASSTVPANMFKQVTTITRITLNNKIKSIGEYAFSESTITRIDYDEATMNIAHHAFNNCNYLDSINPGISNINFLQAKNIGAYAFASCVLLAIADIGNGCQTIGEFAFDNCPILGDVRTGDDLTLIGNGAFNPGNFERQLTVVFTRETAPPVGSNGLGVASMLTVDLLNSTSENLFTDNFSIAGWSQYTADNGTRWFTAD